MPLAEGGGEVGHPFGDDGELQVAGRPAWLGTMTQLGALVGTFRVGY